MKFTVYKDEAGEWRWKLQAKNHECIAVSSEGYKNRTDCVACVWQVVGVENSAVEVVIEGTDESPSPNSVLD